VTAAAARRLYTPDLLALATELAAFPLDANLPARAEVRSRSCGSVIALGLAEDEAGRIARIGMQVSACAIGQASAALLARAALGRSSTEVAAAHDALAAWLASEGPLPDWPDIALLEPARDHPGRHGALMLAWTAAREALSTGPRRR